MAEPGKISPVPAAVSARSPAGDQTLNSIARQDLRKDIEAWFQAIDLAGGGVPFMEDGRLQPYIDSKLSNCSICGQANRD